MKKRNFILFVVLVIILLMVFGCDETGTTHQKLYGTEHTLPDELKGLKVYGVVLEGGDYIKIAFLDNELIGTGYTHGKVQQSVAIVRNYGGRMKRVIVAKEILFEDDTILVVRK